MSEEKTNAIDLGSLGAFDFTPAWAKKDEKVTVEGGRGRVEDDRPRSGFGGGDKPRRNFGEGRKPFGERKPMGDRPRKSFGDKPRFDRPSFEKPQPLACEVKILPETKALGTIIRKIQGDTHAYKLKDLAYFFLDNPESILLKISPKAPQGSQPQPSTSTSFYQCKVCGFASTKEEDVLEHVLSAHLGEYYDAKEIDCEPPKGNFTCVAKCGLSGVLLGPPNIHEFNAVVKEMIRTKYPNMSEADYRSRIEMVRDTESIEAWRASAVKKTVFFHKGEAETEGAAQLTREQAEGEFKRVVLPSLVDKPKHLMIKASVAATSPVKPLVWAVNDAIAAERRAPYAMIYALRGAFHHRKLNFFRANEARGPEFVIAAELKPFDAEHAIPELAAVSKYLDAHPCLDKSEFPAEIADFEKHLQWLVSTGHAVSFTNGVYSAVEKNPKYGPQWKKRKAEDRTAVRLARGAETEETEVAAVTAPSAGTHDGTNLISEEEKKDEVAPVVAE